MMRLHCAAVATLPVLAISAIVENAAAGSAQDALQQCRDDDSFLDAGGYPCHEWRRFDCSVDTLAYAGVAYAPGDMRSVREHCPASCGLCPDSKEAAEALHRCVSASGFAFRPHNRARDKLYDWVLASTVQSVRYDGPSGIPVRCDWVVGTRTRHLDVYGNTTLQPRTVFVRADQLQKFHHFLLPCLTGPIVLLLGDSDATIPRQTNVKYTNHKPPQTRPTVQVSPFKPIKKNRYFDYAIWKSWLADSRIVHIFVSNLDEKQNSSKVSAFPVGMNPGEGYTASFLHASVDDHLLQRKPAPIIDRPLIVRYCNRIKNEVGGKKSDQYKTRRLVQRACETVWTDWCIAGATKGPGLRYLEEIGQYPFVLCVRGGGRGQDPNPCAWSALLAGSIPIIQRFSGDLIYIGLPVRQDFAEHFFRLSALHCTGVRQEIWPGPSECSAVPLDRLCCWTKCRAIKSHWQTCDAGDRCLPPNLKGAVGGACSKC